MGRKSGQYRASFHSRAWFIFVTISTLAVIVGLWQERNYVYVRGGKVVGFATRDACGRGGEIIPTGGANGVYDYFVTGFVVYPRGSGDEVPRTLVAYGLPATWTNNTLQTRNKHHFVQLSYGTGLYGTGNH